MAEPVLAQQCVCELVLWCSRSNNHGQWCALLLHTATEQPPLVSNCTHHFTFPRKKISSQQQRWGSDEENMAGVTPTIQKNYTALALTDNAELPPSPIGTVMNHAVGIDPKWEFPRENIQLSEVLADGQFTVLYKGIARGFKDNRSCEVAIKCLRGTFKCSSNLRVFFCIRCPFGNTYFKYHNS